MTGRAQQIEQEILRILSCATTTFVRLNFTAIARQIGSHQSSVTRVAQAMQKDGVIEMRRPGWYRRTGPSKSMDDQYTEIILKQQAELMKRMDRIEHLLERFISETAGSEQEAPEPAESPPTERIPIEPAKEDPTPANLAMPLTEDQGKKKAPDLPYEAILDLYRETLPGLTQPRGLNDARKRAIRARWEEHRRAAMSASAQPDQTPDAACLAFFRNYFGIVVRSPFLMGEKTDWRADFDWLMKPKNFIKVLEGNYLGSPVKKIVPAISVHNEHDRAVVEAMVREYGQLIVDEAAQTLIRQGLDPVPSRVLKSLREINNETRQDDSSEDQYIEDCARTLGLDFDDPQPPGSQRKPKSIDGEWWIEAGRST